MSLVAGNGFFERVDDFGATMWVAQEVDVVGPGYRDQHLQIVLCAGVEEFWWWRLVDTQGIGTEFGDFAKILMQDRFRRQADVVRVAGLERAVGDGFDPMLGVTATEIFPGGAHA